MSLHSTSLCSQLTPLKIPNATSPKTMRMTPIRSKAKSRLTRTATIRRMGPGSRILRSASPAAWRTAPSGSLTAAFSRGAIARSSPSFPKVNAAQITRDRCWSRRRTVITGSTAGSPILTSASAAASRTTRSGSPSAVINAAVATGSRSCPSDLAALARTPRSMCLSWAISCRTVGSGDRAEPAEPPLCTWTLQYASPLRAGLRQRSPFLVKALHWGMKGSSHSQPVKTP
jgi:hypothetical protein